MENQHYLSNQTNLKRINLFIEPTILNDFENVAIDQKKFNLTTQGDAHLIFLKKNQKLWVHFANGEFCDFPYYKKNLELILKTSQARMTATSHIRNPFEAFLKANQLIEKKIFTGLKLSKQEKLKDLWDEVIKKTSQISKESHSLSGLIEKILDVPFLQNFQSSIVILHLKGQTKAELIGSIWRSEKVNKIIEVKEFNLLFNSIKKSKIKSFSTEIFQNIDLPFNGSFLAKEVISKHFSLICIASRHDFLGLEKEEVELYETCIDLLQPHFERLIDQEFSDKRISELRLCLKDFPLPLRIQDHISGMSFINDLYRQDLQEKDIFFNKKIFGPFTLDLYDSDELRHYAFDLFHFQRISLLGELLNTLRHELSNPLFGLKLGAQIFSLIGSNDDNKEMMKEIEKNINRCQMIIENFSNLYQEQPQSKPTPISKFIDEALVLAKSEMRDIKKKVVYNDISIDAKLNLPIIFVVQIVFNLLVNSSQAMRQVESKKEIDLIISKVNDQIVIDIIDSGPGIPPEHQESLFKPFFTTKSQGTGLGLVLSRNLALKMGGNLEYLDNNKLKGAHFKLTLPAT